MASRRLRRFGAVVVVTLLLAAVTLRPSADGRECLAITSSSPNMVPFALADDVGARIQPIGGFPSRQTTYSEETARKLGLETEFFGTTSEEQLAAAFAAMDRRPPQAISLFADGFAIQYRQRIVDYGMKHRAPVISGWPVFARSGAICSYGPKLSVSYRRLAYYVDRVLKGTPPSDLPIERPTEFETIINMKTAKTLGLTVPNSIIVSADELIE